MAVEVDLRGASMSEQRMLVWRAVDGLAPGDTAKLLVDNAMPAPDLAVVIPAGIRLQISAGDGRTACRWRAAISEGA